MFKRNHLRLLTLSLCLLTLVACGSKASSGNDKELSENYPEKPVEVLVGFAAGGGTDLSARNMTEALNKEGIVEQSFMVDNLPGAEGAIALRELLSRKGNQYTLEAIPEYGFSLWKEAEADLDDYTPIAQVAIDYQTIAVKEDSPYDTMEELIQAIKDSPESIVISSATALSGAVGWKWDQIIKEGNLDVTPNIVPMDGENSALTSLLSGDADVTFVVPQLAKEHVEKGNIKLLATMTDERTEKFSDVPTLKESGIDVTYYRPRGFWMSGDVPEVVADYWEDALEQMTKTDTWKEYVEESGLLLEFKGQKDYKDYILEDGKSFREYYSNFERKKK